MFFFYPVFKSHSNMFVSLQFYLHNHLSFILYFHKEKLEEGDVHNYRVVRFEVVPQSVKVDGRPSPKLTLMCYSPCQREKKCHLFLDLVDFSSDLKAAESEKTCTLPDASGSAPQEIDPANENEVLFTYSVHWKVSVVSADVPQSQPGH